MLQIQEYPQTALLLLEAVQDSEPSSVLRNETEKPT